MKDEWLLVLAWSCFIFVISMHFFKQRAKVLWLERAVGLLMTDHVWSPESIAHVKDEDPELAAWLMSVRSRIKLKQLAGRE